MITGAGARTDAPGFTWPSWGPARGHLALSQFVATKALVGTGLETAPAALRSNRDAATGDRVVAADRFERLRALGIQYALEPRAPSRSGVQQIRDPRWLVDEKCATCLDIAVTYASMCLAAHVAPLLAVNDRHAWVVLHLGAFDDPAWLDDEEGELAPPGTARESIAVWRVDDPDELRRGVDSGILLPVDCVRATDAGASFEDAVRAGAQYLRRGALLIDIGWLHEQERLDPLDPPTRRPGIRTFVPGGRGSVTFYDSRPKPHELVPKEGRAVLFGVPGSGKSTLARAIAADARHGAGWFLDASSRQALINSLARAELAERNERGDELTDMGREGYAYAALDRLREVSHPWVVVLDNADGAPSQLRGLLPEPGPQQLVLVTTTNPAWTGVHPTTELRPLSDAEIARELGIEALVPLVAGRPLLLEAFRALRDATDTDLTGLERGDGDGPAAGPAALWTALRSREVTSTETTALCAIAAQLPPDFLPIALLERLSGAREGTVARLAECGLFLWDGDSATAGLHRLFGATVRASLGGPSLDEAALTIALDREAIAVLDRRGDADTTRELSNRLVAIDNAAAAGQRRCGVALHHLASILELKGDTPGSGALYERAQRHLTGDTIEQVVMRADCLHGRARTVNQKHPDDEPLVRAAIGWARQARELLRSARLDERIGRPLAMEGLLVQKTAKFTTDAAEKNAVLRDALALLNEADRLRRQSLPDDDPERARSMFNLAGVRIDLAQAEVADAAEHLDVAEEVYDSVGRFRREVYDRDVHPHIAACENGLALVNYFRATLLHAPAIQRTAWLRRATRHGQEALAQRELFDGPEDLVDTAKSTRLLSKILNARWSLPLRVEPMLAPLHREVTKELLASGIVVPAIAPLTSRVDPLAHIETWTRSAALAALVAWFGGTAPSATTALTAALERLDEFSDVWDFRRQKRERNQVAAPAFSGYDEMAVATAARAMGLDDRTRPPNAEYDHVIVLGGLARGCLARPLAAAKLLAERAITVRSVIALGGLRPLSEDETALLDRLDIDGLRHELDVMDVGVQRAFGLGVDARLRTGGHQHGRWEIRSYEPDDGVLTHVVAAPAPSPARRANTAETCRWLVTDGTLLHRGESVLLVTTHHYRPFQLADAMRELGAPLGLTIDALGIVPGDYDHRLAWRPSTDAYLQEIRSTIRSYRSLIASLA